MNAILKVAVIIAATLPVLASSAQAWGVDGQNGTSANGIWLNGRGINGRGINGVSQVGSTQSVQGFQLLSVQLPN